MVLVVTIMFTGKDLYTAIKYYVANKKGNRACYLIVYLHQHNNIPGNHLDTHALNGWLCQILSLN